MVTLVILGGNTPSTRSHSMDLDVRILRSMAMAAALLVILPGCAKTMQTTSGAKSVEQPIPAAAVAAAPTSTAKDTAEPALGDPGVPAPSVSASPRSGSDDLVIAKAEPSDATRRQVDEIKQEQAATMLAGLTDVFYGFDSWNLSETGRQALVADAEWLRTNPGKTITIEGHCDERGSQAYNFVLGEKRAKAAQHYLVELGVKAQRMEVVSYGKDRPFCKELDETCYQKNRRSHMVLHVK
jgi:peptidoglycan-associated lipoprotein